MKKESSQDSVNKWNTDNQKDNSEISIKSRKSS